MSAEALNHVIKAIDDVLMDTLNMDPDIGDAEEVLAALSAMPLASRLALARALVPGWAVVPHEIPADLDGVRQLIGITRAQYVRIVAAIEAARTYDATAAEEPPHGP